MTDRTVSRRRLLKATGGIAGLMALPSIGTPASAAVDRPNILFIMADDLGYADLSCFGRRDYRTPALDALAAQGVRFTDAYANSPVCSPTRLALMTGRYQHRLRAGLEEPIAQQDHGLPPDHPTLPGLLRARGYTTALVGKWHLGRLPNYGPLKSGYDHFWGFRGGGIDYFTHGFAGRDDLWDDESRIQADGYLTDLLADRAIDVIRQSAADRKPFFVSLHFSAPHWPWEGPDDRAEAERIKANPTPAAYFHFDGGTQKTYAAIVQRMDHQIGRVLKTLESLGIARNTIVVFTSDNGGERFSDTWPFSGRKTELLEGGIRVPQIATWPGRIPAGSVTDQVFMTMDWLPTLLAMAGGAPSPSHPPDGLDLSAVLTGKAPRADRTVFWRHFNLEQEACREGDWKYLKIAGNSFLFNLADDPLERANLKARQPERFDRLVVSYRKWNEGMLPQDPLATTVGISGLEAADRNPSPTGHSMPPPRKP